MRASNAEATSRWSDVGSGATAANTAPAFGSSNISYEISEDIGSAAGAVRTVGAITATDADGGTITYSLQGADSSKFTIGTSNGQIQTKAQRFDFEAKPSYSFTARASDSHAGETTSTGTVTITVNIEDQTERPLVPTNVATKDITRFSYGLSWTAPTNTGRPAITEYMVEWTTDTSSSNILSKDVTSTSASITGLTHGTKYYTRVSAENADGNGTASAWITVDTRANNAPSFPAGSGTRSLNENSALGATAGSPVKATDQDGDTLVHSIQSPNPGAFTIDGSSGQIQAGNTTYDHETVASYTITVRAVDPHGGEADQDVVISIADVAEPPTKIEKPSPTSQSLTSLTFTWTKSATTGPAIQGHKYQYRKGSASWTTVTTTTPATTSATLDSLDQNSEYSFRVLAYNEEGDGTYSEEAKSTTKTNAAPVISENGSDSSSATRTIPENTTTETDLGAAFTVADSDIADSGSITWAITTRNAPFQITAGTGTLKTGQLATKSGDHFDHETTPQYVITVTVSDGQGATDSITVTISVTDLNEKPNRPSAPSSKVTGKTSITVQWVEPGRNGGPPITGYDLRYIKDGTSQTPAANWTTGVANTTATEYAATNLERGVLYHFQVLAHNGETDSDWSANGSIRTIDYPQVSVRFEQAQYRVDEGDSVDITVRLSEDPERNVTIPISTVNLDGASDTDYSGVPGSLTFAPGDTAKTITFTAADDTADDDGESVKLEFGAMPDVRVSAGARDETTVNIGDDDDPIITVSFDRTTYAVDEGAAVNDQDKPKLRPGAEGGHPAHQDGAERGIARRLLRSAGQCCLQCRRNVEDVQPQSHGRRHRRRRRERQAGLRDHARRTGERGGERRGHGEYRRRRRSPRNRTVPVGHLRGDRGRHTGDQGHPQRGPRADRLHTGHSRRQPGRSNLRRPLGSPNHPDLRQRRDGADLRFHRHRRHR